MKKHLFFAATAALVLASCSSDSVDFTQADVLQAQDDNSVQFDTYMGKTGTTRAEVPQSYSKGAIGNADNAHQGITDLKKARFGVFAYLTTADYVNNPTPTTLAPNFMYNQEVKFDDASSSGKNAWVYSPVKYWPNGIDKKDGGTGDPSNTATEKEIQKLSFFAVAPFTTTPTTAYNESWYGPLPSAISYAGYVKTNLATNGINSMTTNGFTGNVWVKYLMPKAQEDEAVDLLWGTNGKATYTETDDANPSLPAIGRGYNMNLTKQIVGEKVAFLFKHALTKIGGQTVETENTNETPEVDKVGFKIVADVDVNTEATTGDHDNQATYFGTDFNKNQTLITLKSIKIQDGKTATDDTETSVTGITTTGIANSGWFNIETGTWSNQTSTGDGSKINIVAKSDDANQTNADDANYSINPAIREAASYSKVDESGAKKLKDTGTEWSDANPTGVYTTAVPVFAKEAVPGITLIPGGADQKIYITVDYLVRTADPNLAAGYSEVEQVISNEINLSSLQPNKYYTIIIHLGMTSVKFEAVVADWETADNGTFGENGHYTPDGGSTPNETKVWLPSNVVTP